MVNIGSTASGGKVLAVKQDLAKILLTQPVCTQEGEKIALSRRVDKVCAHLYITVYFAIHECFEVMNENKRRFFVVQIGF